jgi:hypothetical protein
MGRPRKQRRQPHGSAWHWKQTDCWYYTLPGTKSGAERQQSTKALWITDLRAEKSTWEFSACRMAEITRAIFGRVFGPLQLLGERGVR